MIECPSFPNIGLNIKNNKIIFKSNEAIFSDEKSFQVEDVKIIIDRKDIIIEGKSNIHLMGGKSFKVEFTSYNGWKIKISQCAITNQSSPSGNFKGKCLDLKSTRGPKIREDEEIRVWVPLENIKIDNHGARTFDSASLDRLILKDDSVKYFINSTGYFFIEDHYNSIDNRWKNILFNISDLLTFFTSNFIHLRIYVILGSKNNAEFRVKPLNSTTGAGSSIFWPDYPGEAFNFINSTYDNYSLFKTKLNLTQAINYFVWMKNASYYDSSKYLFGAIFMETLKYGFAKFYKEYQEKDHRFIKPGKRDKYNFKELVIEIFNEFELDINLIQRKFYKSSGLGPIINSRLYGSLFFGKGIIENLVDHRNNVIHEGNIKLDNKSLIKQMNYLEWIIEILLIKILGVDCLYWDPAENKWVQSKDFIKEF